MRTPAAMPAPIAAPAVPLLDASYLPTEEDWALLEALNATGDGFDPDEDRFAGLGVSAGDFD
ncbi:MAG TPA: hypothetical protein VGI14_12000 [Casimicrobiaceae bacterium]